MLHELAPLLDALRRAFPTRPPRLPNLLAPLGSRPRPFSWRTRVQHDRPLSHLPTLLRARLLARPRAHHRASRRQASECAAHSGRYREADRLRDRVGCEDLADTGGALARAPWCALSARLLGVRLSLPSSEFQIDLNTGPTAPQRPSLAPRTTTPSRSTCGASARSAPSSSRPCASCQTMMPQMATHLTRRRSAR